MIKRTLFLSTIAISALTFNSFAFAAAADDAAITKNVKDTVNSTQKISTSEIPSVVIEVKDGTVYLYGIVNTKDDKKNLEESIKNINGVKKVSSEIRIQGD